MCAAYVRAQRACVRVPAQMYCACAACVHRLACTACVRSMRVGAWVCTQRTCAAYMCSVRVCLCALCLHNMRAQASVRSVSVQLGRLIDMHVCKVGRCVARQVGRWVGGYIDSTYRYIGM